MRLALVLAALALGASMPASADPSVSVLPLDFKVEELRGPGTRVAELVATTDALRQDKSLAGQPLVALWGRDGGALLALRDGAIRRLPLGSAGDMAALERARDAIPAARAVAWGPFTVSLTGPTRTYPHEALGSNLHAGAVTIVERRPVAPGPDPRPVPNVTSRVEAGPGAVFEDRAPRLADLDGDGTPEIVTIKSYLERGSALAVIARRDGRWQVVAETPPLGRPQLWLDPAAIADFDGIGHPQIALVRTPHRDGVLEIWDYAGGTLAKLRDKSGYTDHADGQTAQDLAAIVDLDGQPALAIPTLDRASLALLSMKGEIVERWRVALPARAATGIAVLGRGRDAHILVGLEDGRIADIRP